MLLLRHSKFLDDPYFYGYEESPKKILFNVARVFFKYEVIIPFLLAFLLVFFGGTDEGKIISQSLIAASVAFMLWAGIYAVRHNRQAKKAQKLINLREKFVYADIEIPLRLENIRKINLALQKIGPVWVRNHESAPLGLDGGTLINSGLVLIPGYQPGLSKDSWAFFYHYYGRYTHGFLAFTILTGLLPIMASMKLGLYISKLFQ
jgi:hypothetical protein